MYDDMDAEIFERIRLGWEALSTIQDVLKAKLNKTLCTNPFNYFILVAILYTSETMSKRDEQRLVTTHRALVRSMLSTSDVK